MPLVSICVPCHNAERYVTAALDSVLSQSYQPIEVIVVNDGSTDRSGEVLRQFAEQGVKVIHEKCGSAAKSRNRALREARGEYIKFFDADDLLHTQMIEKQVERLNGSQEDVAFSGWGRFYNDDLSTFKLSSQSVWRDMDARDWLVESFLDARPMMQPGQFLIPRQIICETGGWDEQLTLIDDFEFFSRVLAASDRVIFSQGVPLFYRSGLSGSLSAQKSDAAIESAFHSLCRGTNHLLKVRSDARSKSVCANLLQDFVYTYFPRRPDLIEAMAVRIEALGGSELIPRGSPKFNLLSRLIGWRLARRIQNRFSR